MKVSCPKCGSAVTLDEKSGAIEVCPGCRTRLRAHSSIRHAGRWALTSVSLKMQFAILLVLIFVLAVAFARLRILDNVIVVMLAYMLPAAYFLALCLSVGVPDRSARRSVLGGATTVLLGTVGLFAVSLWLYMTRFGRGIEPELEWGVGFGFFSIYFVAIVLLMRFHAKVARAFGNEPLRQECLFFIGAPIVVAVVDFVLMHSSFSPPVGSADLVFAALVVVHFAVAAWYAMIQFRTFRTIDRGPVTKLPKSPLGDADFPID